MPLQAAIPEDFLQNLAARSATRDPFSSQASGPGIPAGQRGRGPGSGRCPAFCSCFFAGPRCLARCPSPGPCPPTPAVLQRHPSWGPGPPAQC